MNEDLQETPWWIEEGDGFCACCEAAYHHDALLYCVACDRTVCAICISADISTKEILCSECQTHLEEEQKRLAEREGGR